MRTFTFKLESDKDAELLKKLLEEADFESKVEGFVESDEDDLSDAEIDMLDQRLAAYEKDPHSSIGTPELEVKLKAKYGL